MKTDLVRPVLVETREQSNIILNKNGKILYTNFENVSFQCHLKFGNKPQQLILISLEKDKKIEVGDRVIYDFFDGHKADLIVDETIKTHPERWLGFKKVIATQSQLSPEYIQKFIEEYNKGEVKDIRIEMEHPHYWNHWSEGIKLTNGFISIVKENSDREIIESVFGKEPIVYTEEEVITLLHKYEEDMNYYGKDNYYIDCFPKATTEWFKQNKKK